MIHAFQSVAVSARPHRAGSPAGGFFLPALASPAESRYNPASPRTGKLRASLESFRNLSARPHRSGKKAALRTAVSRVGWQQGRCRDAAISLRWLSAGELRPGDRQCLTSNYASRIALKTGQRLPSTRWAMLRKGLCLSMMRTSQTKDLRFGLTERPPMGFMPQEHTKEPRTVAPASHTWPDVAVVRSLNQIPVLSGVFSECGGVA